MEPQKRTVYEEELQGLREGMRDRQPAELTRVQCIDAVKRLELAKFEAQKKMYEFVRSQRVAPQMINAVIKVEKLKADDHFFNETGIEEEDVEPSIKRLNLENDDEFKAIIEEYKVKSDEFLASKKDETAAFMRKAQAAAMMMEARKKQEAAGGAATEDAKAEE
jgi:hypothetical protein